MSIYEALGVLCSFLDISSSIGYFSEDELKDIETAESVIHAYVNKKENKNETFTLI